MSLQTFKDWRTKRYCCFSQGPSTASSSMSCLAWELTSHRIHPTFPARQESRCKCWRVGCLLVKHGSRMMHSNRPCKHGRAHWINQIKVEAGLKLGKLLRNWWMSMSWCQAWTIHILPRHTRRQRQLFEAMKQCLKMWPSLTLMFPFFRISSYINIMNELNNIGRYWHVLTYTHSKQLGGFISCKSQPWEAGESAKHHVLKGLSEHHRVCPGFQDKSFYYLVCPACLRCQSDCAPKCVLTNMAK